MLRYYTICFERQFADTPDEERKLREAEKRKVLVVFEPWCFVVRRKNRNTCPRTQKKQTRNDNQTQFKGLLEKILVRFTGVHFSSGIQRMKQQWK